MEIKTILVTTDFSETSEKAFAPARELAEKFGARLVLAFVEEDRLPPLVIEYTAVSLDDLYQHQQKRAGERLAEYSEKHFGEDLDVTLKVADGTPHVEIIRLAEEAEADLIVMTTHGRGFFSHAFLGSTTERVLRRSPCPVFVFRDTGAG